MTRPRGRPPMPSAMSRPSEPVEIASISTTCRSAPSRMIEPLPKARSIWLERRVERLRLVHGGVFDDPKTSLPHRPSPYSLSPANGLETSGMWPICTVFVLMASFSLGDLNTNSNLRGGRHIRGTLKRKSPTTASTAGTFAQPCPEMRHAAGEFVGWAPAPPPRGRCRCGGTSS